MAEVKKSRPRRRGHTRISAKHQVTIPVDVLRKAGLKPGDALRVDTDATGRVTLVREEDVIAKYAGTIPYPKDYLKKLRAEWDVE